MRGVLPSGVAGRLISIAPKKKVWVFCPKAECKVKKMRVEIDIMHKRRCKKCGARNQDNCTCRSCEDCNEGNCCNNCVCCDSRHDPLTEEEILLNGGCMGMGIQPTTWLFMRQEENILETKTVREAVHIFQPPFRVWTKFRLLLCCINVHTCPKRTVWTIRKKMS